MSSGGILEYFAPGDRLTFKVDESAGIEGGNVVTMTADREVGVAGALDIPAGVALHDAANDALIAIATKGVWPLKAASAVNAGETVAVAAAGIEEGGLFSASTPADRGLHTPWATLPVR
jgi:hypothetical protein